MTCYACDSSVFAIQSGTKDGPVGTLAGSYYSGPNPRRNRRLSMEFTPKDQARHSNNSAA